MSDKTAKESKTDIPPPTPTQTISPSASVVVESKRTTFQPPVATMPPAYVVMETRRTNVEPPTRLPPPTPLPPAVSALGRRGGHHGESTTGLVWSFGVQVAVIGVIVVAAIIAIIFALLRIRSNAVCRDTKKKHKKKTHAPKRRGRSRHRRKPTAGKDVCGLSRSSSSSSSSGFYSRSSSCVSSRSHSPCTKPVPCCPCGLDQCGGKCVDTAIDLANCGKCGTVCVNGQKCCEGTCTDVSSNALHCGDCNTICALGQICVAGECTQPSCQTDMDCPMVGQLCCSDICVNPNDPNNCGTCGNVCGPSEICLDGECVDQQTCGQAGICLPGTVCCNNTVCANLDTDFNNCGSCGNECALGELCCGGDCAEPVFSCIGQPDETFCQILAGVCGKCVANVCTPA